MKQIYKYSVNLLKKPHGMQGIERKERILLDSDETWFCILNIYSIYKKLISPIAFKP